MTVKLFNDDCLRVMRDIESGSIDAIITDPPYYSTDLHFDKAPRIDYGAWLMECKRVLKPSGVLVSFCDLNLLIELRGHNVFKSTYELIWQKTMAIGFLDANRRPLRAHEYMLIMVDGLNSATYNPQKTAGKPDKRQPRKAGASNVYDNDKGNTYINKTGDRHPLSVITFQHEKSRFNTTISQKDIRHPTQKPLTACEWLIKTYSNEGETILDPFAGSGSVGHGCVNFNRSFIGIELNKGYFDIASKRIEDAQNELINQFGGII